MSPSVPTGTKGDGESESWINPGRNSFPCTRSREPCSEWGSNPGAAWCCRVIESVYREHCERRGKEQPECLEIPLSEDFMLTDGGLWQMVK